MGALETSQMSHSMRRGDEIVRRSEGAEIRGDFEGSVQAEWVRLDEAGAGVVSYKGREYKVKTIGFTSIPKSSIVELTYARGVYFAKF